MKKKSIKVLVVGDLMVDHYIYGNCTRISPEAPVPVVHVQDEVYTLGGAGNVLNNIFSFDCYGEIISVVGDDDNSNFVFNELTKHNIVGNGVLKDPDRCTTMKSRVLAINHQLIRMDKEETTPISQEIEKRMISIFEKKVDLFDVVLISDYNKGLLTDNLLEAIFEISLKSGVPTILDPKGNDFSKYIGVDIIKPNKKEASIATGVDIKDDASLELACLKLKEITKAKHIIITLSEDGIAYFTDNRLDISPTKAEQVVDVTGAGDTVLAALAFAIGNGNSIKDACDFANHAAAIVVKKAGSAIASLDEIEESFKK